MSELWNNNTLSDSSTELKIMSTVMCLKHHVDSVTMKRYSWNWTRCYQKNQKTAKKNRLTKKKIQRATRVAKRVTMREIANRKTWFDDNSTWYWKKNSKQKQKKIEKKSIMKISIFRRFVLKTRNFLKSTNHKIFRTFWMKRKPQTFLQQKMSIERSVNTNIKQLSKQQNEDLEHFIQIQRKKLKSTIDRDAAQRLTNQ